MTANQQLNLFAISIPVIIAVFGIFNYAILAFALLSTIITGISQLTIAYNLLDQHYKKWYLQLYIFVCILFFTLWIFTNWEWIFAIPLILAIYMTLIVHFFIPKNHEDTI